MKLKVTTVNKHEVHSLEIMTMQEVFYMRQHRLKAFFIHYITGQIFGHLEKATNNATMHSNFVMALFVETVIKL